uniref:Uncharacterized protein n=1 Tax=Arundo donax TaxID=35708 RepID=A0A0A8Z544_ARUDO
MDKLIFHIDTAASSRFIEFTPKLSEFDEDEFSFGPVKLHVKVTWSVIDCTP